MGGIGKKSDIRERRLLDPHTIYVCMCQKKIEIAKAYCSISRYLVCIVRIRFFSFLVLPSFRSLSQIENRNRDVSVYQC